VILDLSHQLEESDDEEETKKDNSEKLESISVLDLKPSGSAQKDSDSVVSTRDVFAAINDNAQIYTGVKNDEKTATRSAHVNFAFDEKF
jgi:hypothetical protein